MEIIPGELTDILHFENMNFYEKQTWWIQYTPSNFVGQGYKNDKIVISLSDGLALILHQAIRWTNDMNDKICDANKHNPPWFR